MINGTDAHVDKFCQSGEDAATLAETLMPGLYRLMHIPIFSRPEEFSDVFHCR
jgi:hypothetical protein